MSLCAAVFRWRDRLWVGRRPRPMDKARGRDREPLLWVRRCRLHSAQIRWVLPLVYRMLIATNLQRSEFPLAPRDCSSWGPGSACSSLLAPLEWPACHEETPQFRRFAANDRRRIDPRAQEYHWELGSARPVLIARTLPTTRATCATRRHSTRSHRAASNPPTNG